MSMYIKRACTCTSVLWPGSSVCSSLLKRYEDVYLQTSLYKDFFIVTLFMVSPNWKQLKNSAGDIT